MKLDEMMTVGCQRTAAATPDKQTFNAIIGRKKTQQPAERQRWWSDDLFDVPVS